MCAMDDGYLRSGAPPAGARKGAKKELALLRSYCLGTPTARCGIVFLAVCRQIWLFLTLFAFSLCLISPRYPPSTRA
jgi:hypothetical protein